ncbi:dihydroneopterin aldolase [Schumannella sp. 10F1B-5-1]|uniref:dihydroneopterin aldolase n=1 Tax=Schumannella sp. 10F1B-5-1 TaxID=2590780 RepID=UPI0011320EC4|nr:dihydroneopterin aldolase [Schumannella sp. 10F1B-5-1]TPW71628.1 dihydroneopterin aldolase [Schumannella sp. 10F1B-5-1]
MSGDPGAAPAHARPADAPLDSIRVTGLRAFAHHGVFEHERVDGQEFVIDVEVRLPLGPAAGGDDLERTVHYGELSEAVVEAVRRDPVDLIETVAERIAGVALGFPAVHETVVTVHKPSAPIPVPFDDVAVTITRRRAPAAPAAGAAAPTIPATTPGGSE